MLLLSMEEFSAALVYLTVASILIPLILHRQSIQSPQIRQQRVGFGVAMFVAGMAVLVGYMWLQQPRSLYDVLGVHRFSSAVEIRQAYKKTSRILHPDKNPLISAEEDFQRAKFAYDVLMDDTLRDVYNRFGEAHLSFDPRADETRLFAGIFFQYIFWAVVAYLFTIPAAARSSRVWIVLAGLVMVVVEGSLLMLNSTLPSWVPGRLTEHLVVHMMHWVFPAVMAVTRVLLESQYVDINEKTSEFLLNLSNQNKSVLKIVQDLSESVSRSDDIKNLDADVFRGHLSSLRTELSQSDVQLSLSLATLRDSSSTPGSDYYWLVFVLMYGSIFFFQ